jgi:hypothetical protein
VRGDEDVEWGGPLIAHFDPKKGWVAAADFRCSDEKNMYRKWSDGFIALAVHFQT